MRSKIGSNEKKTSVIREMGCDVVLGLKLSGACVRSCLFYNGGRRNRSKNRWREKCIILEKCSIRDEEAREFIRRICPIKYWLDKGRP